MEKAIDLYQKGTHLMDSDPQAAVELLSQAIELFPDMIPAIYNRACANGRLGNANDVLSDISTLEELDPEIAAGLRHEFRISAIPYIDMGYTCLETGDKLRARHYFEVASIYDPDCAEAINALAAIDRQK